MSDHLQNDPDRAGGLVSDAQGEFVAEHPGGVFDPRAFRTDVDRGEDADPEPEHDVDPPPMNDERMVGPGEEIGKTG